MAADGAHGHWGKDVELFLASFQSEDLMRPAVPVLQPTSHRPRKVQPTVREGDKEGDDLNDKDESLVAVSPTVF